jgi:hypothetical protein
MSDEHGKPPVFRTWKGWYWLVMGIMLVQVFMYLWITYSYQ